MEPKTAILKRIIPIQGEKNRLIGFSIFIVGLLMTIFFSAFAGLLITFVKNYLSSDHDLKPVTISDLRHYYFYLILLMFSSAFIIYNNLHRKIIDFAVSIVDFRRLSTILLTDRASGIKKMPGRLLFWGSVPAIFLVVFYAFYGEPKKEGTLEDIEAIILLLASIIMALAAIRTPAPFWAPHYKRIRLILFLLAFLFFAMFGEEISWGQVFLNFKSPEFFNDYNYQAEFNLHNFFNPLYDIIYKTVGICFFTGMFLIWFFRKEKQSHLFELFIPPASLSLLIFLMACTTFGNREIFETQLYIFLFLYSTRIFLCLRNPATRSQSESIAGINRGKEINEVIDPRDISLRLKKKSVKKATNHTRKIPS